MKLYTVKEVAKILNFKEDSVRNMIYQGRLEAVKIGRSVRVTKEALEKFIGMKLED